MAPRMKNQARRPRDESPKKGVRSTRVLVRGKQAKDEKTERRTPGRGVGRSRRISKSRKEKKGKYTLKLKGWLKTPADWARFQAWAKVNALPKKYPEPEPIVRPSKPLYKLKRRLKILAKPREAVDPSIHCKSISAVSETALKAVARKRTLLLSLPIVRLLDYGRVYYKVSPAALNYKPSERILELSQPRQLYLPEECRPPKMSKCAMKHFSMERLQELSLAKKLVACPQALTPEEIAQLFTPAGVRRTALKYQITAWMKFLAIPPYKKIRHKTEERFVTWKKTIIEEGERRGKEAIMEQQEKRGKKRKREESENGGSGDAKQAEDEGESTEDNEKKAKRRKIEKHAWRYAPHPLKKEPYTTRKGALTGKVPPRTETLAKAKERKDRVTKPNAFSVKKAALSASASGRIESLAQPKSPRGPVETKSPREKDEYGRPIFEMPVYGKVLPKTKPYKMGDCPPKEEKKVAKKRPIDPIAYEATIDPCIYPDLAKRQKRERKRAEKLSPKKKNKRRRKMRDKVKEKDDDEGGEEVAPADAGEEEVAPADEAEEEVAPADEAEEEVAPADEEVEEE